MAKRTSDIEKHLPPKKMKLLSQNENAPNQYATLLEQFHDLYTIEDDEHFIKQTKFLLHETQKSLLSFAEKAQILKKITSACAFELSQVKRSKMVKEQLSQDLNRFVESIFTALPAQPTQVDQNEFDRFIFCLGFLIKDQFVTQIHSQRAIDLEIFIQKYVTSMTTHQATKLHALKLLAMMVHKQVPEHFHLKKETLIILNNAIEDAVHKKLEHKFLVDIASAISIIFFNHPDFEFSPLAIRKVAEYFEANLNDKMSPLQLIEFIICFGALARQSNSKESFTFSFDTQKNILNFLRLFIHKELIELCDIALLMRALQALIIERKLGLAQNEAIQTLIQLIFNSEKKFHIGSHFNYVLESLRLVMHVIPELQLKFNYSSWLVSAFCQFTKERNNILVCQHLEQIAYFIQDNILLPSHIAPQQQQQFENDIVQSISYWSKHTDLKAIHAAQLLLLIEALLAKKFITVNLELFQALEILIIQVELMKQKTDEIVRCLKNLGQIGTNAIGNKTFHPGNYFSTPTNALSVLANNNDHTQSITVKRQASAQETKRFLRESNDFSNETNSGELVNKITTLLNEIALYHLPFETKAPIFKYIAFGFFPIDKRIRHHRLELNKIAPITFDFLETIIAEMSSDKTVDALYFNQLMFGISRFFHINEQTKHKLSTSAVKTLEAFYLKFARQEQDPESLFSNMHTFGILMANDPSLSLSDNTYKLFEDVIHTHRKHIDSKQWNGLFFTVSTITAQQKFKFQPQTIEALVKIADDALYSKELKDFHLCEFLHCFGLLAMHYPKQVQFSRRLQEKWREKIHAFCETSYEVMKFRSFLSGIQSLLQHGQFQHVKELITDDLLVLFSNLHKHALKNHMVDIFVCLKELLKLEEFNSKFSKLKKKFIRDFLDYIGTYNQLDFHGEQKQFKTYSLNPNNLANFLLQIAILIGKKIITAKELSPREIEKIEQQAGTLQNHLSELSFEKIHNLHYLFQVLISSGIATQFQKKTYDLIERLISTLLNKPQFITHSIRVSMVYFISYLLLGTTDKEGTDCGHRLYKMVSENRLIGALIKQEIDAQIKEWAQQQYDAIDKQAKVWIRECPTTPTITPPRSPIATPDISEGSLQPIIPQDQQDCVVSTTKHNGKIVTPTTSPHSYEDDNAIDIEEGEIAETYNLEAYLKNSVFKSHQKKYPHSNSRHYESSSSESSDEGYSSSSSSSSCGYRSE